MPFLRVGGIEVRSTAGRRKAHSTGGKNEAPARGRGMRHI